MEQVKKTVEEHFGEAIQEISKLVCNGGEHLLVCGLDPEIISIVTGMVKKNVENSGMKAMEISSALQKDENPQGKVLFIKVGDSTSTSYQSLIYHYLEKTRELFCSLVLVSNSCLSLDGFERRVRSRFNHRVFFLPFLPLEPYTTVYKTIVAEVDAEQITKQYGINPSISVLLTRRIIEKYKLPEYSIDILYGLLNPIHITLIIMTTKKRIKYINCVSEFRMFVVNVNELKKIDGTEILFSFLDLVDSGIIDKDGELLVDPFGLKRHVMSNRPLYLKSLVNKNI